MICILSCLLFSALPVGDKSLGQNYARPELLMEVEELEKILFSPKKGNLAKIPSLHLLDARDKKSFEENHIPGADWVDHNQWAKENLSGKPDNLLSQKLAALGLHPDDMVVIYDDNSAKNASRIWWILKYHGFRDVRLLNGGWPAWLAGESAKLKATIEFPRKAVTPKDYSVNKELLKDKQHVLQALKNHQAQIIDTRSYGEYCGDVKSAKRGGAIPGAIHLEWKELIDPKTQKFKTAKELSHLFQKAGIDLKQPAITHCQSGGRASVMVFGMELMGANQVGNYYRGWSEWGNLAEVPIEQPKKK